MTSTLPSYEAQVAEARRTSLAYMRLFESPDGKTVLSHLKETFRKGDIRPSGNSAIDPLELARNFGRREVIDHIKDVVSSAKELANG
jgi:hypothetical protein